MSVIKPTMKLVTAGWQDKKSFRLMPITKDCPFSEGIYDPDSKVLVLMSIIKKESFHMVPRLDDNGDPMQIKLTRPSGKKYKEERRQLETFTEYYISEKAEIEEAIKDHATNASTFDYQQYILDKPIVNEKSGLIVT